MAAKKKEYLLKPRIGVNSIICGPSLKLATRHGDLVLEVCRKIQIVSHHVLELSL
jgi:hypothetical protein